VGQDQQELKGLKVLAKVHKEPQDLQGPKVQQETLELKDLEVHKVLQVLKVLKVLKVLAKVHKERQDLQELKVQ
jgi:hypothetical protein